MDQNYTSELLCQMVNLCWQHESAHFVVSYLLNVDIDCDIAIF